MANEEKNNIKIRHQYFNIYIFLMLTYMPAVPVMIIMQELRKGNLDLWGIIAEMSGAASTIAVMYAIFIGPFIILSIINRFAFGKVLGVVSDGVLTLNNQEISIKDILEITYHPCVISRRKISSGYATVVISNQNKTESVDLIHFPVYGLWEIKKQNSEIKIKCDKYIWLLIFGPTVIFAVMGFLFG